jgi:hypothetical protein
VRFKVLISLKVKLLFYESFLLEKYLLDREENQRLQSTSIWIRGEKKITETTGKNVSCSHVYLLIDYLS